MKDFKAIRAAYNKVNLSERNAALATVVSVEGSSYRSPGARMLITDDGKWVGSISGGCLEGDALRKARKVMMDLNPMTVTYDTREENNQGLAIGLGCQGVIDVLIEPLAKDLQPLQFFDHIVAIKSPSTLATVFSGKYTGEKVLVTDNVIVWGKLSHSDLSRHVCADLMLLQQSRKSEVKSYAIDGDEIQVFLEFIQPVVSLIVFGGGVDARPVCQLAQSLGWETSVTDECVAHIAPIFFPGADKLSLCSRDLIEKDFDITPYTACVLMSHNYDYDRDVLKKLIRTSTPYIGILGPRKRFEKMLNEFAILGIALDKVDLNRIHAPIGLDIGAEAADEIAVSIIAEIQAKFANRSGGFLKNITGPIHQREADGLRVLKTAYGANHQ